MVATTNALKGNYTLLMLGTYSSNSTAGPNNVDLLFMETNLEAESKARVIEGQNLYFLNATNTNLAPSI